MARFQPAPDIWNPATRAALDSGALTLQPGQWIRLGDGGQLSRFYRHNPATGHIVAFHGLRGAATRKMREYVTGQRETRDARALAALVARYSPRRTGWRLHQRWSVRARPIKAAASC